MSKSGTICDDEISSISTAASGEKRKVHSTNGSRSAKKQHIKVNNFHGKGPQQNLKLPTKNNHDRTSTTHLRNQHFSSSNSAKGTRGPPVGNDGRPFRALAKGRGGTYPKESVTYHQRTMNNVVTPSRKSHSISGTRENPKLQYIEQRLGKEANQAPVLIDGKESGSDKSEAPSTYSSGSDKSEAPSSPNNNQQKPSQHYDSEEEYTPSHDSQDDNSDVESSPNQRTRSQHARRVQNAKDVEYDSDAESGYVQESDADIAESIAHHQSESAPTTSDHTSTSANSTPIHEIKINMARMIDADEQLQTMEREADKGGKILRHLGTMPDRREIPPQYRKNSDMQHPHVSEDNRYKKKSVVGVTREGTKLVGSRSTTDVEANEVMFDNQLLFGPYCCESVKSLCEYPNIRLAIYSILHSCFYDAKGMVLTPLWIYFECIFCLIFICLVFVFIRWPRLWESSDWRRQSFFQPSRNVPPQ